MNRTLNALRPCWRVCATAFLLSLLALAYAADQPQWGERYTRNMVSEEKGLPDTVDLATGQNVKWKAELGTETYSTPVIAKGRVFIGTNNERPRDPRHKGDRSVLLCLDEKDGRLVWQLVMPKLTNSIFWDWPKAGICSPATVEGDRVYLVGNRGEVLCLDINGMANGNQGPFQEEAMHSVPLGGKPIEPSATEGDILWLFDYVKECGVRQHDQAHSSILIDGDFLYVNTSNGVDDGHRHIASPDAPSLIVLEKTTGRLVAMDNEHIGPRIFHSTWSSPGIGEVNGRPSIIFAGGDGIVYAFERLQQAPPRGQVLKLKKIWQFDCDPEGPKENVHRYNSNRKISPSNVKSMPVFHQGRVYVTAGGDLWWGKNESWLKCFKADGNGDITKGNLLWSYALERHSMSTPAVVSGLVFASDCGRKIHCVDAKTGQAHWVQEAKGDIWGSPLVADGKVYCGSRSKDLWIFNASKEKKVLATIDFDSPLNGTPVAANGVIYVTSMRYLYALQVGQKLAMPSASTQP